MRRRTLFFTLIAALLVGWAGCALALELQADAMTPFDENPIRIISDQGGLLTIEAVSGTNRLENPVTAMAIESGTTEVTWRALTWGGEPVPRGPVTLRAVLEGPDGGTETAECTVQIRTERIAAVCVLPAAQQYYPSQKEQLKIEVALSRQGSFVLELTSDAAPGEVLWSRKGSCRSREPAAIYWNGKLDNRQTCPAGAYTLTAYSVAKPDIRVTAGITILAEPLPAPELAVTGPLLPEDLSDDAAVWAALMAPVAVGNGFEGKGFYIYAEKQNRGGCVGTVNCRTVGLTVQRIDDDGWVLVGAWRQTDGAYVEGYVKWNTIMMVRPNTRYGAVLDKEKQTLTVYEDGHPIGTALVSTGLVSRKYPQAETQSGVYLVGTRMASFRRDGYEYEYPLRIDGANLIHSVGSKMVKGLPDYSDNTALLGQKASHGCVRVDVRVTEESNGINIWWLWTHLGRDTKILVTEDSETRHLTTEEALKK